MDIGRKNILAISLVQPLLQIDVESSTTIDLLDHKTWGEHDFSSAKDLIWTVIAQQAYHQ